MTADDITPSPDTTNPARSGLSRRSVVTAAAWSVPVVVAVSATPAHATSAGSTLTVNVVETTVTAGSGSQVTATVLDSQGRPWAGQPITFTVNVAGITFAAASGVTNAAGQYTTTLTTTFPATPAGVVTVTATSDGYTATDTFTVLSTNVVAAGDNGSGQIGDGTTTDRATPVYTARVFPSPVMQVEAGSTRTTYLLQNGTVWQGGANVTVPAQVSGLAGVTQIASGFGTTYALLSNGEVRAWGANAEGQLGDGTTTNSTAPVVVRVSAGGPALTGVTAIGAAHYTGYAVLSNGQVRAWGRNNSGQLGNGTTTNSSLPVTVRAVGGAAGSALTGVIAVSGGQNNAYALLSNGEARGWGFGNQNNFGNNTPVPAQTSPVAVRNSANTANLTGIAQIVGNWVGAGAVLATGQALTWGTEMSEELGNGTGNSSRPLPGAVDAVGGGGQLTGIVEMAAFTTGYVARTTTGAVVGWGQNNHGTLGNGAAVTSATPVQMILPTGRTAIGLAGTTASTVNLGKVTHVVLAP